MQNEGYKDATVESLFPKLTKFGRPLKGEKIG
jgi:hypothetical protein